MSYERVPTISPEEKKAAPSILKVFPYSTVGIIGILLMFKYDRVDEMIQIVSEYFEMDRNSTIIIVVIAIMALMVVAQLIWSAVYYFLNMRKAAKDAELLYEKERNALIAIFNSMDGKLWRDKTRWCSDEPIERWKGVKIDHNTGRVNKIILPENNLGGEIPAEIGDLACLKEVDFRLNRIRGVLPNTLVQLQRLEGLYLFDNFIEGQIPVELSNLPALTGIYLYNNCFENTKDVIPVFKENMKEGSIIYI